MANAWLYVCSSHCALGHLGTGLPTPYRMRVFLLWGNVSPLTPRLDDAELRVWMMQSWGCGWRKDSPARGGPRASKDTQGQWWGLWTGNLSNALYLGWGKPKEGARRRKKDEAISTAAFWGLVLGSQSRAYNTPISTSLSLGPRRNLLHLSLMEVQKRISTHSIGDMLAELGGMKLISGMKLNARHSQSGVPSNTNSFHKFTTVFTTVGTPEGNQVKNRTSGRGLMGVIVDLHGQVTRWTMHTSRPSSGQASSQGSKRNRLEGRQFKHLRSLNQQHRRLIYLDFPRAC